MHGIDECEVLFSPEIFHENGLDSKMNKNFVMTDIDKSLNSRREREKRFSKYTQSYLTPSLECPKKHDWGGMGN